MSLKQDSFKNPGPPLWGWCLALVAVEILFFRLFSSRMGLYVDDWAVLRMLMPIPDQSLKGLIIALGQNSFYYLRPGDIIYFPLLYWLAGPSVWVYHAALLAMESVSAICLFLAFHRATQDLSLSFLTALVFLVYPSHAATHHWYNAGFPPSMMFFSAALCAHMAWCESRSRLALGVSVVLLVVGTLIYEAVLPLVILMPFLSWWTLREPASQGRRLCATMRQSWPILATAAALFAFNIIIQRLYPKTISRQMSFDSVFAIKVFERGLECSFTAWLDLLRHCLRMAIRDWSGLLWFIMPLPTAALVSWLARHPWPPRHRVAPQAWLAGASTTFAASYLPYAISADRYIPHIFDVQNRINAPASLPAAMIVALGLSHLRPNLQKAVLAALLLAFTLIHWQSAREWRRSWEIQQMVLADLRTQSERIPPKSIIYLEGAPSLLGTAPLFNESWVFSTALQDSLGRWDVQGELWDEGKKAVPLKDNRRFVYQFLQRRLKSLE